MKNKPLQSQETNLEEDDSQKLIDCANKPFLFSGNTTLRKGNVWKGVKQHYGLSIKFESEEKQNEIKYELCITYFGRNDEGNDLYQLDRTSPVYVDETLPDLVADKLAYRCGEIFYPLLIETNERGKFLCVKNVDQIKERWLQLMPIIESDYTGEYAAKYIELMNLRLEDELFIHICIQEDWLIQTYFQDIFKDYRARLCLEEYIHFAHLNQSDVGYKTKQSLNPLTNHFGSIELSHSGELELDEEDSIAGTYQATYYLHPISKAIQAICAQWTDDEQKVTLELYTTDEIENAITPYHLLPENRPSVIVDSTDINKKSFW